jgi:AcrR family transcriptional regulator
VRDRLFAALTELIADRGYDAITLADVAAAAGIGRTAVYNHFPDKESVLLALAEQETQDYLKRLRAALASLDNPAERLMTLIRMQLRQLGGHHAQLAALGPVLSEGGRRKTGEHVAPMATILRETLADAMAQGYLPEQDLDVLAALVSAVIGERVVRGVDTGAFDRTVEHAAVFVLLGAGGRVGSDGRPRHRVDDRSRAEPSE